MMSDIDASNDIATSENHASASGGECDENKTQEEDIKMNVNSEAREPSFSALGATQELPPQYQQNEENNQANQTTKPTNETINVRLNDEHDQTMDTNEPIQN